MKNKYFKNYYLIKFREIVTLTFFVFLIIGGIGLYVSNLPFLSTLKKTNPQLGKEVLIQIYINSVLSSIIVAIFFGGLLTLMLYAQKEKQKNIKSILLGLSVLIGIFLFLAYFNLI